MISQETFDRIVEENMNDFGLTLEESIQDTIEQLKLSGVVDFSLINTSGKRSNGSEPTLRALASLNIMIENSNITVEEENLLLQKIHQEFLTNPDNTGCFSEAVLETCSNLIPLNIKHPNSLSEILRLVSHVCSLQYKCRVDFLLRDGVGRLRSCLRYLVQEHGQNQQKPNSFCFLWKILISTILTVVNSLERAKIELVKENGAVDLIYVLDHVAVYDYDLYIDSCKLIRSLLTPDDPSTTIFETFTRAKLLAAIKPKTISSPSSNVPECGCLSGLLKLFESMRDRNPIEFEPRTTAMITVTFHALKALAISDEICEALAKQGVITICNKILRSTKGVEPNLVYSILNFLNNMAGRDECKDEICSENGPIDCIVETMKLNLPHENIQRICCESIASLTLRRPRNARIIWKMGGINIIAAAMEHHKKSDPVFKACCFALRNMVSRDEEIRQSTRENEYILTLITEARQDKTRTEIVKPVWRDLEL